MSQFGVNGWARDKIQEKAVATTKKMSSNFAAHFVLRTFVNSK